MNEPSTRTGARALAAAPGVPGLLAASVLARLPLAMFSIALLVHVRQLTGSFAVAGAATGAYAAAQGVGGPLLGRVVDRRGQTLPLLASASWPPPCSLGLAALPSATPPAAVVALAALLGLATPPVGACARSLLPELLADGAALRAAYAFESSAVELTFIFGPPLALGIGALWSTGAALAAGGLLLLGVHRGVRRPARLAGRRPRPPALRAAAAARCARPGCAPSCSCSPRPACCSARSRSASPPRRARWAATASRRRCSPLWGAGSLVGGVVASRLGGGAKSGRGLALVLAALAAGHLALAAAAGSAVALGGVLFLAGAAIAPAYASIYAMVDAVAPEGTVTEAFAWLATAMAVGAAAGAAASGALADGAGPGGAFLLAGVAGGLAVAAALLGAPTLPGNEKSRLAGGSTQGYRQAPSEA